MNLLDCPSAPALAGGLVIGVVQDPAGPRAVTMLRRPLPLSVVAPHLPADVPAGEVLRVAAPCAEGRCAHFAGGACSLARRVVAHLPAVVDRPPPCPLRPRCRWWVQEGAAACVRCPQITTEPSAPDATARALAVPRRGADDPPRRPALA